MQDVIDQHHSLLSFADSVGIGMQMENRWVKLANQVPWHRLEARFPTLISKNKCKSPKPFRIALVICMIQAQYDYSNTEILLQVQENPYLQYLCGYERYQQVLPFTVDTICYFQNQFTAEVLEEIKAMISSHTT